MGFAVVNLEFRAHAQPVGGESQAVYLHRGDSGLDESHPLTLAQWKALQAATMANNRTTFESVLTAAATPTGGWSPPRLDASWRAALRCWAP